MAEPLRVPPYVLDEPVQFVEIDIAPELTGRIADRQPALVALSEQSLVRPSRIIRLGRGLPPRKRSSWVGSWNTQDDRVSHSQSGWWILRAGMSYKVALWIDGKKLATSSFKARAGRWPLTVIR